MLQFTMLGETTIIGTIIVTGVTINSVDVALTAAN